jgi:hypothetical protein
MSGFGMPFSHADTYSRAAEHGTRTDSNLALLDQVVNIERQNGHVKCRAGFDLAFQDGAKFTPDCELVARCPLELSVQLVRH